MTRVNRGDKVIPLPVRLNQIEDKVDKLERRVDRLFAMIALLIGLSNTPNVIEGINKLLGH